MDILISVCVFIVLMLKEMLTNKQLQDRLKDIDEFVKYEYIPNRPLTIRDWQTYEKQLLARTKHAVKKLKPLIKQATSTINVYKNNRGRKPSLDLERRLTLLLVKHFCGHSNRLMSGMLSMFTLLTDVEVGYKTVERLYSEELVEIGLHNLHKLLLNEKQVQVVHGTADGTGYSLTISKHYYAETQKHHENAKRNNGSKAFVYSFKILDLDSNLYCAFGTSLKSERDAYHKALEMLLDNSVELADLRLDKYYSNPSTQEELPEGTKLYIIPKKNATINGSYAYKESLSEFVNDTSNYLHEYYGREHSEAEWSADKRRTGWQISQRLPDRINTADFCNYIWHNLFNLL